MRIRADPDPQHWFKAPKMLQNTFITEPCLEVLESSSFRLVRLDDSNHPLTARLGEGGEAGE